MPDALKIIRERLTPEVCDIVLMQGKMDKDMRDLVEKEDLLDVMKVNPLDEEKFRTLLEDHDLLQGKDIT